MRVIKNLNSNKNKGLDLSECESRLKKYGLNKLPDTNKESVILIFLKQFCDPLIYILLIGACFSIFLKEYTDGIFIFVILTVNSIIGCVQEYLAKKSVDSLKKIVKSKVVVIREGLEKEIDSELLVPGDIVILKYGSKVPADIILLESENLEVNESMLTGESMAVEKNENIIPKEDAQLQDKLNELFAGTIITKGVAKGIVISTGKDTEMGKIADKITQKTNIETPLTIRMKSFSKVFTIIVCFAVAFVAIVSVIKGGSIKDILLMSISLAVSSIPEALPITITIALSIGMLNMSKRNVVVRNLSAVEALGSCTVIASDKTGTLTEGKPEVIDFIWSGHVKEPERAVLASILYSIENRSEHPLADAVTRYLKDSEDLPVEDFKSVTGAGAVCTFKGMRYFVGSRALMELNGIQLDKDMAAKASELELSAHTVVWFSDSVHAMAIAVITDRIKPGSAEAAASLRKQGVDVWMLTGDNENTAAAVASKTGILHFKAGVLPQDKSAFVKKLQSEGRKAAMAGDGINDSAALAQADLSIAMGNGSDIAMDVADMTVISSDLQKIPEAIQLSKMTVRTIRQNLFWAFIYNMVSVPIAAGVLYPLNGFLLNPMIAGAAMAFSSVSVVANSLRLKNKRIGSSGVGDQKPLLSHTHVHISVPETSGAKEKVSDNIIKEEKIMKKTFKVEGMMCGHCRMHVEKALNALEGVKAVVTLDPPAAEVEFSVDHAYTLEELQKQVSEEAGEYTLSE